VARGQDKLLDGFHEPSVPVLKRLKKTNIDIRDVTHALARYAPEDSSHQPIPPRLAVIITLMISLMMGAIINGNSLPLFLLTLMLNAYFLFPTLCDGNLAGCAYPSNP
jgi:hypothetical protein